MNDPDNFLSRWSRRKRDADARSEKADSGEGTVSSARGGEENPDHPVLEPTTPLPEFDVSSLPPIESIGADTDISAFMQKGVPAALRHAALRRVWSADPAIRDFMGPTENYWDAAGPDGIPGFGGLDPNLDVKRMVSGLFGETVPGRPQPETLASPDAPESSAEISDGRDKGEKVADASSQSGTTGNAATQKMASQEQPHQKTARRHGGAMPE